MHGIYILNYSVASFLFIVHCWVDCKIASTQHSATSEASAQATSKLASNNATDIFVGCFLPQMNDHDF